MKIVLATNNQGKIKELSLLLKSLPVEIIPQNKFEVMEAQEIGLTFVENAILKARNASEQTGLPAIADDSGIAVNYLNGMPGIYSARYAGINANASDNNQKLLTALKNIKKPKRGAKFICVMVYLKHAKDPMPIIAEGIWYGEILSNIDGANGFGYDPIFYAPEYQKSVARLTNSEKNQISHRAKALAKLQQQLIQIIPH